MPPNLPVASSPRPISRSAMPLSERWLSSSRCDSTSSKASSDRASVRIDDHRAGEALGFLAPGAAEHQPDEAEEGERAGGDRDPLRDCGEVERLAGKRAPGRPGAIGEPQRGEDASAPRRAPARPPAPLLLGLALGPLALVERRARPTIWSAVRSSGSTWPRRLQPAAQRAVGAGCHDGCSLPSLTARESD